MADKVLYSGTVSTGAYSSNSGYVISDAYTFKVDVVENSTSVSGNYSKVTTNIYIKGRSSSWHYSYGSDDIKAVLTKSGDTDPVIDEVFNTFGGSTDWTLIKSVQKNVPHNADGTGSASYVFNWIGANPGNVSSGLPKSCSLSTGNIDLTPIARASTISVTNQTISKNSDDNTTEVKTKKATSSFRDTIRYKVLVSGSSWVELLNYTNDDDATSKSFNLTFADLEPTLISANVTSATVTVQVETHKDGSASADIIGTNEVQFQVITGVMPISLYDNGRGRVGVSIGRQATRWGFYVDGAGPFSAKTITYKDENGQDATITVLAL